MPIVPVSPWAPDQAPLSGGTSQALNVLPVTQDSYGPWRTHVPTMSAVNGPCRGIAAYFAPSSSTPQWFCGTQTKLYTAPQGAAAWTDVSGIPYTGSIYTSWDFCEFGNTVIATNSADPIQSYTFGSSTSFGTLSTSAPIAQCVATVKNFVVVGDTNDPVGGYAPWRVWWSALNNAASWPTPGSDAAQAAQSDYNDIYDMGAVLAIKTGVSNTDAVVFFRETLYRMDYVGPPNVFDFQPVQGGVGILSQRSCVLANGVIYYLGRDGFYAFDGATNQRIGIERVDNWFFSNMNMLYSQFIVGGYDYLNKAVIWTFASNSSQSGVPDMLLAYAPFVDRWSYGNQAIEWLTAAAVDTYDNPRLLGFNASHEAGLFTGAPAAAEVSSQETQAIPGMIWGPNIIPGQRLWMQGVRPLVDGGSPTVAMASRNRLEDAQTIGADIAMDVSGVCPQRVDARYMQALIKVPAGASWNHCQGADFIAIPAGFR